MCTAELTHAFHVLASQSTDVDLAYRKAPTTELAEEISDAIKIGSEASDLFASQVGGAV